MYTHLPYYIFEKCYFYLKYIINEPKINTICFILLNCIILRILNHNIVYILLFLLFLVECYFDIRVSFFQDTSRNRMIGRTVLLEQK